MEFEIPSHLHSEFGRSGFVPSQGKWKAWQATVIICFIQVKTFPLSQESEKRLGRAREEMRSVLFGSVHEEEEGGVGSYQSEKSH